MPGICGLLNSKQPEQLAGELRMMLDKLAYANCQSVKAYCQPSAALGCATLPHSTTFYDGEQAVVVFNGYIVQPGAQEPARRIYELYTQVGAAPFGQLEGTFSAAIWDKTTQQLILGTDRFGLQPVYYLERSGFFAFASELKALLILPDIARRLHDESVANLFFFGFLMGNTTLIQDIYLLPPGSVLVHQGNSSRIERYWHMEYPCSYPSRSNGWYDELIHDAIQISVSTFVESERRYAIALSGGLDTRWIASLMSENGLAPLALTFGVDGCDDRRIAAQVAQIIGLKHVPVPLTDDVMVQQFERAIYITDGVYSVFHANEFPLSLAQTLYADISVGGYLGGELFGSRVSPRTMFIPERDVEKFLYKKYRRNTLPDHDLQQLFGAKRFIEFRELARESLRLELAEVQTEIPVNTVESFDIYQRHRRRGFVGQLLKQAYIAGRYPFVHRCVAEAALQLPPWQRLAKRAYRRSLIAHFPSMDDAAWEATLLRPSTPLTLVLTHRVMRKGLERLPGGWLPHQWSGLPLTSCHYAPYGKWLCGNMGTVVRAKLSAPEANPWQLFDPTYLQSLLNAQVTRQRNVLEFISLALSFDLWSRFALGALSPPDLSPGPDHNYQQVSGDVKGIIL